jgi:hypothetical protein
VFDSVGPALAASLAQVDATAVDEVALVDAICGWERLASWAAAGQLAALAELARRRPPVPAGGPGGPGPGGDQGQPGLPSVGEFAVDEVAAALRLSRVAAGIRLHVAVEVAERLPETGAALRRGDLDLPKVRRIVEATTPLPAEAVSLVERQVLPRAATQTASQLRASLARAVLAVDPADAEERHRRAVADRRVCITPQDDGMAELWALLPADGAAAIRHALDVVARRSGRSGRSGGSGGSDGRTMDNRRADALVELVVSAVRGAPASGVSGVAPAGGGSAGGAGPARAGGAGTARAGGAGTARAGGAGPARAGGAGTARAGGAGTARAGGERAGVALRADVQVTVPAGTLLGLSDEPGVLAGHGPIPASMARRLAADGTWRRILTDPIGGAVLDVGRRSYAPPAALADHVIARDQTCRFPGCQQPAQRCDLDHTVPFPRGSTSAGNLAALCRHHHRLKHLTGWQVEQPEPGVLVWTSPAGRRHVTRPRAA